MNDNNSRTSYFAILLFIATLLSIVFNLFDSAAVLISIYYLLLSTFFLYFYLLYLLINTIIMNLTKNSSSKLSANGKEHPHLLKYVQ